MYLSGSGNYGKMRTSPDICSLRFLLDGFPRGLKRWLAFKEDVQELWRPHGRTWVVVMDVNRNLAQQRFVSRARSWRCVRETIR